MSKIPLYYPLKNLPLHLSNKVFVSFIVFGMINIPSFQTVFTSHNCVETRVVCPQLFFCYLTFLVKTLLFPECLKMNRESFDLFDLS